MERDLPGLLRRVVHSRPTVSALTVALVFATLITLRTLGVFAGLEVGAYDAYLRLRPPLELDDDNPVVIVTIREEEIQKYGHPLCDARLALGLAKLQDAGPYAIGVDIWRDIPITACTGRVGEEGLPDENTDLGEVATRDDRVVMLAKPLEEPPIAPPAFLEGTSQISVPDWPVDPNGIVHRAIAYYSHEGVTYFSLSLQLAIRYLRNEDIFPVNDPDQPNLIRVGETTIPHFTPNVGGYVNADAGGYQYLVDFAAGHEGFPVYSMEDVFTDAIPDAALRDKVVLVGTDSTTVKDEFYTPLSAGLPGNPFMLGVELHAHATGQLIRFAHGEASPMVSWSDGEEAGWILLWCALGGLLGYWNRSAWITAVAGLAGLGALFGATYWAFLESLWLPVVPPLLATVTAAGLITAYRALIERAERGEVTSLFSRFLRPEIADVIWEQRDEFIGPDQRPRAQKIMLTSLMSDLQGYTTASESMDPEDLMAWINEYMNTMADLVGDFHGVVDDYAGDGIKANFGFPIPSRTDQEIRRDAYNAVCCALAMGEAMDRLNASWRERNMPTGRVRVGIYTGPAVVGILGGGQSLKYTTVGDTINTAARLESFAKDSFSSEAENADWRVLAGDGTMEWLDGAFATEDLGSHALKGKHEEIRIFRVLGPSDATDLADDGSASDPGGQQAGERP